MRTTEYKLLGILGVVCLGIENGGFPCFRPLHYSMNSPLHFEHDFLIIIFFSLFQIKDVDTVSSGSVCRGAAIGYHIHRGRCECTQHY